MCTSHYCYKSQDGWPTTFVPYTKVHCEPSMCASDCPEEYGTTVAPAADNTTVNETTTEDPRPPPEKTDCEDPSVDTSMCTSHYCYKSQDGWPTTFVPYTKVHCEPSMCASDCPEEYGTTVAPAADNTTVNETTTEEPRPPPEKTDCEDPSVDTSKCASHYCYKSQ